MSDERLIELRHEVFGLLGEIAGKPQRLRDGATMMAHDARWTPAGESPRLSRRICRYG
jgi:hypothetical protein